MPKKESYEYIQLEHVDKLRSDIDTVKTDLAKSAGELAEKKHLKLEKEAKIAAAKKLIDAIALDLERFDKHLLKNVFEVPKPVKKQTKR